jgi:HK97 family phage portal protein
MRIGGYELTIKRVPANLSSVDGSRGGWWPVIGEPYPGAWQNNAEESVDTVVANSAVFACVTLIAQDVAKMRLKLVSQDADGIWAETDSPAFSPVLRKPNHYQNRIQFYYWWMASKLLHGNTYVLLQRDQRGVVVGMYILDPTRCRPLVAPDGGIYYELKTDALSGLRDDGVIYAPAAEIIHDVGHPLFHPLVGVSPIYACGVAALQGIRIQNNSSQFFANGSKPGGVLTAPGPISQETAARVKAYWDTNFTGDNMGKVAVLGDGLKYEAMAVNAKDAELVEQLKWTGSDVCTAFKVPGYKVGIGTAPSYNTAEMLNQQYYDQCLQFHVESLELAMDVGLGLAYAKVNDRWLGTEFETDDLLRMDYGSLVKAEKEASGIKTLNEQRRRLNHRPVKGGDTVYIQEQYWPVRHLAERPLPSREVTPPATMDDQPPAMDDGAEPQDMQREFASWLRKSLDELDTSVGLTHAHQHDRSIGHDLRMRPASDIEGMDR